jgi:hypothetical protein
MFVPYEVARAIKNTANPADAPYSLPKIKQPIDKQMKAIMVSSKTNQGLQRSAQQ